MFQKLNKKVYYGLTLAVVVALLLAPLALADNVFADGDGLTPVTNQDLSLGNICQNASVSGNVLLAIQRSGGGQVYANNASVTVSAGTPSNSDISVSMPDQSITLPSDWVNIANSTMSSDTASSVVTVNAGSVLGSKSGSIEYSAVGNENPSGTLTRKDTLNVFWSVISCAPTDSSAPDISYVLDPASPDGDNGWYKSDVTLTWTVSEPESPGSLVKTGCDDQNITADQPETTYSCSATSDGGSAGPVNVSIKRDATLPTISGSASPAANGAGWNNTDVDVSFTCGDNLSGVASCGPDQTLSSESAGQSATGTAVDNAGNSASDTVSGINIDQTVPTVSVTGVSDGATYTIGDVPVAGCSTTDALSGVKTHASLSSSGGPVGSITATCSGAEDNADNSANPVSATYNVIYAWNGFFRPVDNDGVMNAAKAGQAIPLKWRLTDAFGNPFNTLASENVKVTVVSLSCSASTTQDLVEEYAAGASGLQNLGDGNYQFNWKTPTSYANSCKTLKVDLGDGVATHTALFQFKK